MYSPEQYRMAAARYEKLLQRAKGPNEVKEYTELVQRYTTLADDANWLATHRLEPAKQAACYAEIPVDDADGGQSLRRLGAAITMKWDTLPGKLRRELLETARSMGDLE